MRPPHSLPPLLLCRNYPCVAYHRIRKLYSLLTRGRRSRAGLDGSERVRGAEAADRTARACSAVTAGVGAHMPSVTCATFRSAGRLSTGAVGQGSDAAKRNARSPALGIFRTQGTGRPRRKGGAHPRLSPPRYCCALIPSFARENPPIADCLRCDHPHVAGNGIRMRWVQHSDGRRSS